MLIAWFQHDARNLLVYDREAILYANQWWRMLSAPLAHWTTQHLWLNGIMLLPLSIYMERRSWRILCILYVASTLLTMLYLIGWRDDIHYFAGASGLITGMFVWCLCDALRDHSRYVKWFAAGILSLLVIKLSTEAMGINLPWSSSEQSFTTLWQAHAIGALCAAVLAYFPPLSITNKDQNVAD